MTAITSEWWVVKLTFRTQGSKSPAQRCRREWITSSENAQCDQAHPQTGLLTDVPQYSEYGEEGVAWWREQGMRGTLVALNLTKRADAERS